MSNWTTPDDIRAETERLWSRGQLLACLLHGIAERIVEPPILFPYRRPLRGPRASELGSTFGSVRDWVQSLSAASRSEAGTGFEIEWRDVKTRQLGRNRLPSAFILPSLDDALALIGRSAEAGRFAELAAVTLRRLPGFAAWIARKPFVLLDHEADWTRILDVIDWFLAHPKSGVYVRQIDVPGVDSKFIEARKTLLSELMDLLLPADATESEHASGSSFEARRGLKSKPALIRFRVLDPSLAIAGLTDLTVPVSEFAVLGIGASRVFVVENEVTFLAFPELPGSLVIFGSGYGVERLAAARWLAHRTVIYWGDIDTHGFAILDRLRAIFPQTKSLLMDRATLLAHQSHWSFEPAPKTAELSHLSDEERALYDDLRYIRLGSGVRLEQERVPFNLVCSAILACR
jgi:hypothetical protein